MNFLNYSDYYQKLARNKCDYSFLQLVFRDENKVGRLGDCLDGIKYFQENNIPVVKKTKNNDISYK